MTILKVVSVAGIGMMLAVAPGLAYADHLGDPLKGHSQLLKTGQGAAAGQEAAAGGAAGAGAAGGIAAGTIGAVAVAAAIAVAIAALAETRSTTTTTVTSTATDK